MKMLHGLNIIVYERRERSFVLSWSTGNTGCGVGNWEGCHQLCTPVFPLLPSGWPAALLSTLPSQSDSHALNSTSASCCVVVRQLTCSTPVNLPCTLPQAVQVSLLYPLWYYFHRIILHALPLLTQS